MIDFENKPRYDVYDLVKLIRILRAPGGCPWDAEQTHESIRRNFVEEVYEVVEAIDEQDSEHLREELGDVLTQVVFHAELEREAGRFELDDVADMVVRKLIYRHPHVFGDTKVSGTGEVLTNWDALKKTEKHQETAADTLRGVAKSLPALWRAEKVQKKAAKVGFDWPDAGGAMDKLGEELGELREAVASGEGAFEELGDILFSAVNTARHLGIDPEEALTASTEKFIRRFDGLESEAARRGLKLEEMSLGEMDKLYEEQKRGQR